MSRVFWPVFWPENVGCGADDGTGGGVYLSARPIGRAIRFSAIFLILTFGRWKDSIKLLFWRDEDDDEKYTGGSEQERAAEGN